MTAMSGGGPAYVFLLIEALRQAGIASGLPADLALPLARATVAGSGELRPRSDEPAAVLRQNVTSPGGTTQAALEVLMADGRDPAVVRPGDRGRHAPVARARLSWRRYPWPSGTFGKTKQDDTGADLLVTAFELIAEHGWSGLSLVEVAKRAGVSPAEVYRELPGRASVLRALSRRIDEAMLAFDHAELAGLPPRDRVFELLMRRLEALVPFRPGLERLARAARCDPGLLLASACQLDRGLAWLQDSAGLRRSGVRARLARRALGAAYLQTLRVWLKDESADLGPTMAELDKQLRRVQTVAGLRAPRAGRAPEAEAPQPA